MEDIKNDKPSVYITKQMLDMIDKSLVLSDERCREPIRENWIGELLIKMKLKRRGYKYPEMLKDNPGKMLRVRRVSRVSIAEGKVNDDTVE